LPTTIPNPAGQKTAVRKWKLFSDFGTSDLRQIKFTLCSFLVFFNHKEHKVSQFFFTLCSFCDFVVKKVSLSTFDFHLSTLTALFLHIYEHPTIHFIFFFIFFKKNLDFEKSCFIFASVLK
jgi:hypothetical protein